MNAPGTGLMGVACVKDMANANRSCACHFLFQVEIAFKKELCWL
jgi:hypothetical protein